MERIIIIEPIVETALASLEKIFQVERVTHLYELRSALLKQPVAYVFCPVRIYHPRIGEILHTSPVPPKLVFIRTKLDKIELIENDPIPYWNRPYSSKVLYIILRTNTKQSLSDLQRIHVMEKRKMRIIPVEQILLIKKIPAGQVLIHTTEGDHLVNANLTTILQELPDNAMERISDQLLVPVGSGRNITQKGFAFRGGYIQIRDRYLKTRKKQDVLEEY